MRRLGIPALALATVLFWQAPANLSAQTDEIDRIQKSITVLQDLTKAPDDGIPQYLLARAEAIVVIPNLVKGGFVVGAKHGRGVMSVRDRTTNTWSAPVFVKLTGGSVGWQIGAAAVDLVLLVMNKGGVQALLDDKFTIGGNLTVAAGPVGRAAEAATSTSTSAGILAYSRTKGLFAGATLEGAALRADDESNEAFYGRELSLQAILTERELTAKAKDVAISWRDTLRAISSAKK